MLCLRYRSQYDIHPRYPDHSMFAGIGVSMIYIQGVFYVCRYRIQYDVHPRCPDHSMFAGIGVSMIYIPAILITLCLQV